MAGGRSTLYFTDNNGGVPSRSVPGLVQVPNDARDPSPSNTNPTTTRPRPVTSATQPTPLLAQRRGRHRLRDRSSPLQAQHRGDHTPNPPYSLPEVLDALALQRAREQPQSWAYVPSLALVLGYARGALHPADQAALQLLEAYWPQQEGVWVSLGFIGFHSMEQLVRNTYQALGLLEDIRASSHLPGHIGAGDSSSCWGA